MIWKAGGNGRLGLTQCLEYCNEKILRGSSRQKKFVVREKLGDNQDRWLEPDAKRNGPLVFL